MAVNRGSISELLAPDLRKVHIETGKERPLEYTLLFNVDDMPWNPMTDQQVSGLSTLEEKPEGDAFTLDEPIIGGTVTYTATAYGLALEVTWEAWRDELYGVMAEMIAEFTRASNNRQEVSAWSILNNAFSASYAGFDTGKSLCSTTHSLLDGATQANRPSPEATLSQTAIQSGLTAFGGFSTHRSLPRLIYPTRLVVDYSKQFLAREILGSGGKPATAENTINAVVDEDLVVQITHYLTTSSYWFLIASPGIHDLNFFWRDRPIFDNFDDPWSRNAVFTIYQRQAHGYGRSGEIYGSTGGG